MFCKHCKQDLEIVYKNGWCRECVRAYYQANKDRIAEKMRAYYQANKDRIAEKKRAYCQANKDRIAEKKRAYYQANKDRINRRSSDFAYVIEVERELDIRRITGLCQTCGCKITHKSDYVTYCSYACYRSAFRKYARDKR